MAIIRIQLEKGECIHSVKEHLAKALATDDIMAAREKYNDVLMEDLIDEIEKEYSNIYLQMTKDIVERLKGII